jgi:enoyl-CoA hydratase/carnithine racemase
MNNQKNISWEKRGTIGILSIDNPPENYIREPDFIRKELMEEISNDPSLKGIIIKGTGRHFSAGADIEKLKHLARNEDLLLRKLTAGKDIIKMIENMNAPVVAAIKGVCFGAGLEIALACHFRICSENTLFAFPETNHGIMPGLGGTVLLSKLIGPGRSAEIILTGEIVNSQKALDFRLVDYVLPGKDFFDFSLNMLEKLTADRDIDVIHSVMRSIHNSLSMTFEEAMNEETKLFCALAAKSMTDNE